jgi:four helix bundle protein
MSGNNFKELLVWRKARVLATRIYTVTRAFPREEMFGMSTQMRRSALSIVFNIAEGKGRYTHADYRSFLIIARGSAFELDAQLSIATDLQYIAEATANDLSANTEEIARMLNAMIDHLSRRRPL